MIERVEGEARALIPLAVSDVRQWTFCQRVLWHRRMMPHRVRETPKMQLGREAEHALERLERRRVSARYGLEGATRRFSVHLESATLGVRGACDLVLESRDAEGHAVFRPVEVKRTQGGASRHHAVQLAGYGILLEEHFELPAGSVTEGFILVLPADELVAVDIGGELRAAFIDALREIREMLETERFPLPTVHASFCPQCEYVRFCGDVL